MVVYASGALHISHLQQPLCLQLFKVSYGFGKEPTNPVVAPVNRTRKKALVPAASSSGLSAFVKT